MIGRRLVAMAITLGAVALAVGAAANQSIPHGEGVYWRIDRPGAPPSYILGTIHFGAPCEINLGSEVARRIGLSRVVFLELRLDQTTAQSLQDSMFLPAGQSLPALIGYDTFKMITPYARARGITIDMLARLKPWVAWQLMAPFDPAGGRRSRSIAWCSIGPASWAARSSRWKPSRNRSGCWSRSRRPITPAR